MTEQEKAISQLCIAAQDYCNKLREDYDILDNSYHMDCIENCIEKIHRKVNPEFDDICKQVEALRGAVEGNDE